MLKVCGKHSFSGISIDSINKIFSALKANGASVQGNNPWKVDTNKHGVVLWGSWDEPTSTLLIGVKDKALLVPCSKIWDTVVPLILAIRDSEQSSIV